MYRRHNLAKRRVTLAAIAVYAGTRALAYVPAVRGQAPQEPIVDAVGGNPDFVWVLVAAWAAVALVALARLRTGCLRLPITLLVTAMIVWGSAWGIGWIADTATLHWQTAVTYIGPAVVIATLYELTVREVPDD